MSSGSESVLVTIDGLGSTGDGVGRLEDGRVVFVPGGLPGDVLRVRLLAGRKRVHYGEALSIETPSPDRLESRCAVEPCGGCALRALSFSRQGDLKRERLVENFRRIGHLDVSALVGPLRQVGDGWRYRHRVRLHAHHDGRRWRLGYHAQRSHTLVPLVACPVLWPELEAAALAVGEAVAALPVSIGLSTVELVYSRRDGRAAARFNLGGDLEPLRGSQALGERAGLSAWAAQSPAAQLRIGNLELRYDHKNAADFDLRFEPGVFTQAFPEANDRVVDSVVRWVRPSEQSRVLELHAGIGNLTLPLGRAGARLVAVEMDSRAVILCRRNAANAGITVDVHAVSDAQALAEGGPGEDLRAFDVLLIDPPRTGAREVAERAAAAGPARVVYLSCDSATLARDSAILVAGGYRVEALEVHDFFPQTPHVEALALFER